MAEGLLRVIKKIYKTIKWRLVYLTGHWVPVGGRTWVLPTAGDTPEGAYLVTDGDGKVTWKVDV